MSTVIATMSQPLRATECMIFLESLAPGMKAHLLTSDSTAFADLDERIRIHHVTPAATVMPTRRLLASRINQRIIQWARSGSTLGMKVQKWARALMWRLRYLDRLSVLRRGRRRRNPREELLSSPIYDAIAEINQVEEVTKIVVFDVFDLPVAMRYAELHNIEVLVR
jgi:hypothetical protein